MPSMKVATQGGAGRDPHWRSLLVTLLAITLGLNACAAKRAPSLSEEQRGRLGRLEVVVVETPAEAKVAGPTPLGGVGGAVTGAAIGVGVGVVGGAGCFLTGGFWGAGCALALMTPYWVGRGTVEGALNARPESERRANKATIIAAIDDVDRQRIARTIEQERHRRSASEPPAAHGTDTLAEVTLLRLGLEGRPSKSSDIDWKFADPELGLVAEAGLRVVTAADGTVLFERTYVHRSGRVQKFAEWARDTAAEFRNVRDEALDALAREIAGELFGAEPAPAASSEEAKQ